MTAGSNISISGTTISSSYKNTTYQFTTATFKKTHSSSSSGGAALTSGWSGTAPSGYTRLCLVDFDTGNAVAVCTRAGYLRMDVYYTASCSNITASMTFLYYKAV